MYGWIWRKLPFGLPGKLVGSLALAAGMLALLWFVAFPAIRPMMPWSNVDVGGGTNVENEEGGEDEPDGDEPTCTQGVDCAHTGFDPEDYQTAAPPEDAEDQEGDG
ncbi:hypothetical protein L0U85_01565 [Glycomyces sp. L485]|uniref:hypothetical protein n=1 Tax=Glycomyces sp. L485 TaxID=2909235 RepID=UPI001F4AB8A4|nr:hypothetical protein [Glycomyces sp. L485]MCH7229556.1 hypothetical protein [Glycomyces sp. L485]